MNGTFPNEEKKAWEEKCPSCGEEFLSHRGGPQCQTNNCSQKQLEEKHRTVAQPMVDYLLPDYRVKVDHPNNSWDGRWGWSYPFSHSISIPWYTLRIKDRFFNNVVHESAHIPSTFAKTSPRTQKTIEEWEKLLSGYKQGKIDRSVLNNFFDKHGNTLEKFKKTLIKSDGGHWGDPWYLTYLDFYEKLLNSSYGIYAYGNKFPMSYGFGASGNKVKGKYQGSDPWE